LSNYFDLLLRHRIRLCDSVREQNYKVKTKTHTHTQTDRDRQTDRQTGRKLEKHTGDESMYCSLAGGS